MICCYGRKMDFLVRLGSFRTVAVQGYTDRDRQVTNQHIRREGRHVANLGSSVVRFVHDCHGGHTRQPSCFAICVCLRIAVSLGVSVFWANDRVEPKLDLRVK
ncbi:hypothetical protein OIU84_005084 [Salix udensis]|uniref:Uncharacterized protein n=1 Tax=Salix udensis TaxID=889485 RepID=A0AAD6JVK3_9ROSI|nr:hypothetical protein OIU84_005084 [Salix udensis]